MRKFIQILFGIGCGVLLNAAVYAAAPTWSAVADKLGKAQISAPESERVIAQAKQAGADPATVDSWADRIAAAQAQQLPAELLTERLMQGLAKGVPAARIARALSEMQTNLAWCKQVLEAHVAKAELRAHPQLAVQVMRQLEGGLRAGLSPTQWEQIFDHTVLTLDQLRAVAQTGADLRTLGAPVEQIVMTMHEAAKGGADPGDLDKLNHGFVSGIAKGAAAPELMQDFRRELKGELAQEMRAPAFSPGSGRPDISGSDMAPGAPGGGQAPAEFGGRSGY